MKKIYIDRIPEGPIMAKNCPGRTYLGVMSTKDTRNDTAKMVGVPGNMSQNRLLVFLWPPRQVEQPCLFRCSCSGANPWRVQQNDRKRVRRVSSAVTVYLTFRHDNTYLLSFAFRVFLKRFLISPEWPLLRYRSIAEAQLASTLLLRKE
jgi:hypothetical protein